MSRLLAIAAAAGLAAPVFAAPAAKSDGVTFVDIQSKANQPLADDVGGRSPNNTLAAVPTGEREFARVKFKVGEKCVQLASPLLVKERPARVEGIAVGRKAEKLHFLHTTLFGRGTPRIEEGDTIAEYKVTFDDGTSATVPVKYGEDVRDWWHGKDAPAPAGCKVKVAWEGDNEPAKAAGHVIRLYLTTWKNPHPGKKVASIDFARTDGTPASPILVALTAE